MPDVPISLMDVDARAWVAVSPSYERDKRVFFYASTSTDNRVLRTTFRNGALGPVTPILTGIPNAFNHDGGRMIFGPDGWLVGSCDHSQLQQRQVAEGAEPLPVRSRSR